MDRPFQRDITKQGQAGREEAFQPNSYNKPPLLKVFFLQKNSNPRKRRQQLARQGKSVPEARVAVFWGSRSRDAGRTQLSS